MAVSAAIDTNAMRLWQLANQGLWSDASQQEGPEEALAMLQSFLYGNTEFWIPHSVTTELQNHGDPDLVERTARDLDVLFLPLEVTDEDEVDSFVARWCGRGASEADARWLGEVWHVGRMDAAVTFDLKLIRGLGEEIEGLRLFTPRQFWEWLEIPAGAAPRKEPAPGHPLTQIDGWRI